MFALAIYMFALASLTAAMKAMTPAGMLKAKMIAVGAVPQSGLPEESSNMEPTAAIAVKQAIPKYAPLLGVIIDLLQWFYTFLDSFERCFKRLSSERLSSERLADFLTDSLHVFYLESVFVEFLGKCDRIFHSVNKHDAVEMVHFMLNHPSDQVIGF